MSALMIARITVEDPEKFREYLTKTQQVAGAPGKTGARGRGS